MNHVLISNESLLELLASNGSSDAMSPEEFLSYLEEALESGELTINEAAQLVEDYNRR